MVLEDAGADVKVFQRLLGHAAAALTLDRYGHLLPGQAEQVALRLDEMARQARPQTVPDRVDIAWAAGSSRDGRGTAQSGNQQRRR
jgi:hypothetical protein